MKYNHLVPELSEWIQKLDGAVSRNEFSQLQDLLISIRKHLIANDKQSVNDDLDKDQELKRQVGSEIEKQLMKLKAKGVKL